MARKDKSSVSAPQPAAASESPSKWKRRLVIIASGVAIVSACVFAKSFVGSSKAEAQQPTPAAVQHTSKKQEELPKVSPPKHDVMAVVNGEDIRRDALAAACVDRYGKDTLESLVNKRLIEHHCRNRGITITNEEIDAEVDRMAERFKLGRQQLFDLLEKQRGVNEQQYKRDILWPVIAMRKLAADQLVVSDQQVQEAYESQFGEAIKARLIIVNKREQADQLRRELVAQPNDFAKLAMQNSQDVNSASIGGLIQPIRHHVGDAAIEKEVFALQPNEISGIIPVGDQFAILKCEERLPPRDIPLASVKDQLVDRIKEEKLRVAASELFGQLQSSATIQNIWNDPQLRQQLPGVVATVNGEQIPYKELADECLARHGKEVLEVEISHLLLQQALGKAKVTITQEDLDGEITHAAQLAGVVDKQGKPDFDKWFQMATKEQGVTKEQYMRDSVWPSAALKKITGGTVQVSDDDLQKSYSANFGERMRCRAIVLGNMRRAQEVWGKARQNTSMDFFGDLAEQYSIEAQSKALRGEVPPIRRNGGQPQLEEAAFELQPNELSGIIQLGDKFVLLKCEGRTETVDVSLKDVRDNLRQDIFEKKLRIAMSDKFAEIREKAKIDNYLAGTSQSPDRVKGDTAKTAPRVDSAVRPTAGAAPQPR